MPRASARQSSAILSSIEFDRDATLFATAGVSKRISIFDFATVSWRWPTACSVLTVLHVCMLDEASSRAGISCPAGMTFRALVCR